jgi:hypothetical protein
MSLGYRAVLRLPETVDAVALADDQMRSWLRGKLKSERRPRNLLTTADWDGPGVLKTGPGSHLTVVRHEGTDGSVREMLRHVEERESGTWAVSVVAASLPGAERNAQSLVIELDVGDVDPVTAVTKGAPPNIVKQLLETVEIRDGATPLRATPVIVRALEVEELLQVILDPARNVAVVVAGALPGVDVDPWRDALDSLLRESRGVATGYVLTPAAQIELARRLPDSHAVEPTSIRTFAPQVDLDDPADGLRHRTLGPRTLARHVQKTPKGIKVGGYLPRAHARTSRQRFLDRPLPSDLSRTLRILSREELHLREVPRLVAQRSGTAPVDEVLVEPATPREARPEPVTKWDGLERRAPRLDVVELGVAQYARVSLLLAELGAGGLEEEHLEAAEASLARLRGDAHATELFVADLEALEEERNELRTDLELQELFTVDEARARRSAEAQVRVLRREVAELQRKLRAARVYDLYVESSEDQGEDEPDDVEGIVELLLPCSGSKISQYVVFTGDPNKAAEVDLRDSQRRHRGDLWEQVLVLYDYARTKYQGNVQGYLEDEMVTTRKVTLRRFAKGESESVMTSSKRAAQRLLPVPPEVDPAGRVYMWSHFKPPRADMFAPRLHFHDDTKNTGKVFIGYIGRHLDTTTKGN